jgi:hypothetical protein
MSETILLSLTGKLTRQELALVPTPIATATHKPIPHVDVINALVETLGFRHISVHAEEYAVSRDGMKLFGVLELTNGFEGCRFAIGIRNAHDKSMRLALTVGYRVLVCDNMAFHGDFEPVLARHTKNFRLLDTLSIGIDQMQRNFKPMVESVERWRAAMITEVTAKLVIYQAFIEGELDIPRGLPLARHTHELYFNPAHDEFAPGTMWSLSNAFTSAFKELDPIPQYKAIAKLAPFLEARTVTALPLLEG